jgi:hypothetical protein
MYLGDNFDLSRNIGLWDSIVGMNIVKSRYILHDIKFLMETRRFRLRISAPVQFYLHQNVIKLAIMATGILI